MQTIGYLKQASKDNGESYNGQINTLKLRCALSLVKPLKKASERSPDFDVYAEGQQNNLVKVGAAWKKKGRERQFFTIEIDDPSFPDALSALAFRQDDDSYNIVWKRAN